MGLYVVIIHGCLKLQAFKLSRFPTNFTIFCVVCLQTAFKMYQLSPFLVLYLWLSRHVWYSLNFSQISIFSPHKNLQKVFLNILKMSFKSLYHFYMWASHIPSRLIKMFLLFSKSNLSYQSKESFWVFSDLQLDFKKDEKMDPFHEICSLHSRMRTDPLVGKLHRVVH